MRISTNQIFDANVRTITSQQAALQKVSQQISAERKLLTPADDPVAAAREVALNAGLRASEQMQRNQRNLVSELQQTENFLIQAERAVQSAHTRLVQGGSAILDENNRQTLLADLVSLRDELLSVANSTDEAGNYVFGGFKRDTQPFVQVGGSVAYQGDQGVRQSQIGPNRFIDASFSGHYLFSDLTTGSGGVDVRAAAGNQGSLLLKSTAVVDQADWDGAQPGAPYTVRFGANGDYTVHDLNDDPVGSGTLDEGDIALTVMGVQVSFGGWPADGDALSVRAPSTQSVFAAFDEAIAALSLPQSAQESTQRGNALFTALGSMQAAQTRFLEARAAVGTRTNAVDAATETAAARSVAMTEELASVVGGDSAAMIELASELAKRTYSLQAAQLSYAQIAKLSIFNYL